MEKLPPTSYVRLVDVWLIIGQLIPFVEVIILTLREILAETDAINHHGFERPVSKQVEVEKKLNVTKLSLIREGVKNKDGNFHR